MKHLAHGQWDAHKSRTQGDLLDDTEMFTDEISYVSITGNRWTEAVCRADKDALEFGQVISMDGLFGSLNLTEPA